VQRRMNVVVGLLVGCVLLLVLAGDAAAAQWRMRDDKGTVAGTITLKTRDGKQYAEVAAGSSALSEGGWVEPRSWGALVQWYRLGLPYAKKVFPDGSRWKTPYHKGVLRRVGDTWVAYRVIDGQRTKVATVSHACPGRYALGAAMILRFPPP
jgi:hypothetical protein